MKLKFQISSFSSVLASTEITVLEKGRLWTVLQADTDEGKDACKELGVDIIPTVQFWKSGQKLWEHRGIVQLENDLGEGNNADKHDVLAVWRLCCATTTLRYTL